MLYFHITAFDFLTIKAIYAESSPIRIADSRPLCRTKRSVQPLVLFVESSPLRSYFFIFITSIHSLPQHAPVTYLGFVSFAIMLHPFIQLNKKINRFFVCTHWKTFHRIVDWTSRIPERYLKINNTKE